MRNALIVVALALVAWFAYTRAVGPSTPDSMAPASSGVDDVADYLVPDTRSQFSCDGRTRCSQMTSCEEAEYFLRNCPGVEMDGNNDGEPCESQWCGNSQ
jgi:hypothetical protein